MHNTIGCFAQLRYALGPLGLAPVVIAERLQAGNGFPWLLAESRAILKRPERLECEQTIAGSMQEFRRSAKTLSHFRVPRPRQYSLQIPATMPAEINDSTNDVIG
jgi:hypothetical protein